MPPVTRVQLVLIEVALAASAIGVAVGGAWLGFGPLLGLVALVLAAVPYQGRWLYQVAASAVRWMQRRRSVPAAGLRGVIGTSEVVTLPPATGAAAAVLAARGGTAGPDVAVLAAGSRWTVPLVIAGDAPVPLPVLEALLRVEDIDVAEVRLLTFVTARASAGPTGRRIGLLSIDTDAIPDVIAARGGTEGAVTQIVRRSALRAEQVFAGAGVVARPLTASEVTELLAGALGPAAAGAGGGVALGREGWRSVRTGGTWSQVFASGGRVVDVAERLDQLAIAAGTGAAATVLGVRRTLRGRTVTAGLIRLSGPGSAPDASAEPRLRAAASSLGLTLHRLDGEHGPALRATTPIGR